MRWIWIDRFEEFESGKFARAIKTVSMAEDHLHHQYPGFPIMPQSLIIEGLAQTGGILVGEANDFCEKVVLAKLPKVRFFDFATPGDVLVYDVELQELRAEGAICAAKVSRAGQPFGEAEIVFAHLDKARFVDDADSVNARNFVFTKDHLVSLLRMAKGSYHNRENRAAPHSAVAPELERNGQIGRV